MTTPHIADVGELRAVASGMKKRYLRCRGTRTHLMADDPVDVEPVEGGCWEVILECQKCDTLRTLLVDSEGDILASSYVYPEDYPLEPGIGRIDAEGTAIFRLAWITNLFEEKQKKQAKQQARGKGTGPKSRGRR
jgi:hypothetical protein